MITIDTNSAESFLFELIKDEVERKRLDVGDIIISNDELDFILERKTWQDFAASICDGRWSEQQSRMHANNDDSDKKRMFGYIIEGPLIDWKQNGSKMNPKCLWAALIKAQVRDNFYIFHTIDKISTIELVSYIHQTMKSNGFGALENNRIVSGLGKKRKRDNLADRQSILIAMLTVIPGISKLKAEAIIYKYPTITDIKATSSEALAEIVCGKKKIGSKIADEILNFLV